MKCGKIQNVSDVPAGCMDVHGFYSTAYLSDIWGKTRRVARQFVLLNDELRIGAILAKPNTQKIKAALPALHSSRLHHCPTFFSRLDTTENPHGSASESQQQESDAQFRCAKSKNFSQKCLRFVLPYTILRAPSRCSRQDCPGNMVTRSTRRDLHGRRRENHAFPARLTEGS